MAAKKTSKKQSKSEFIRNQAATLSAAEVVAKGKAAGIKFSPQLVYNVRGGSKAKQGSAKKISTERPVAATSMSPVKMNKADFVRSRSHLSPKEIVEDAKAAGMKLDVGYVYSVRGYAKSKGKAKVTKQAARRSTAKEAPPVARRITTSSKAEDLLRAIAAEVGLGRAIELLEAERARVHAVLRG
jgi:hypothetical protein